MHLITDRQAIAQALECSDYRAGFSFDITPHLQLVRFAAGETIMRQGGRASHLGYLFEGRIKLFITHENGNVSLLEFPQAPCFIGEMELIGVLDETIGVTALTDCACFLLPIEVCRDRLLRDPVFLRRLCVFLGNKSHVQTGVLTKNLAYPLKNRLADFILLAEHNGVYREKHTETAEYLGVTYRHLLYVFAQYTGAGILQKQAASFVIRDRRALERLASS